VSDYPPLPDPSDELSIDGFTLGHGSDLEGKTGVTVILCPQGATAVADVRGSGAGTRQFDSLTLPQHLANRAHAVVLSGGSGFGLSSADVVVEHLRAGGYGFDTSVGVVPLVPTAILFDLAFGDPDARPGRDVVESAVAGAGTPRIAAGSVGVGTGATVGKALGPAQGMKGGFGFVSLASPAGPKVAAAVAVNAFGDVRDPHSGIRLAGCRASADSQVLVGADRVLARLEPETRHPWESNTTLAVVLTDARLTKTELRKVCDMAFGGLYRALDPALSLFDGDMVVTLTTGEVPAHVHRVGVLAQEAVSLAIVRAIREAQGFGLLPAWRDLPGNS